MSKAAKQMSEFKFWSNTFYIVPLVLALYFGLWPTAVLIVAVVGFGTLYHLAHEKRFFWEDTATAWSLIFSNLILCYLGNFQVPYFWVACVFLALSLLYYFFLQARGEYDLNHGMWHIYGSLITLFCIFTYVL